MSEPMSQANAPRTGPLAGVKILDMSSVMLGPLATVLLADLGADVIKVESPRGSGGSSVAGDIWRFAGNTPVEGLGPMFVALNRNKRAVALDLAVAEDRAVFDSLLDWADVFVHNVRMAGMKRLGLDYEAVRERNPSIIYAHCAGFGQDGPYGPLSAYDDLIQAASGYTDLVARRDGGDPGYTPSAVADKITGLFAANAVLAALFHRERTGSGQLVQVPMFESMTFFNMVEHLYGQTWKSVDGTMGYTRSLSPHRRPYATKDGFIAIVPYNDRQWRTFLELGGFPDLFDSPKFTTYKSRTENIGELYEHIGKAAVSKTTAEWLAILQKADIPAIRCNRLDEVLTDEHMLATGFFQQLEHPDGGAYIAMKHPVSYSESPAELYRHPPRVGEHDEEIRSCFGESQRGSVA
jgi:crotonobetainyl-CoA:carnitine CoA-transferase CaiB-like acyl-CoA transferase